MIHSVYVRGRNDKNWPRELPYPLKWKELTGKTGNFMKFLYSDNISESIHNCREFFIKQGWEFEPGDITEIHINHDLMKGDTRIFRFSEKLIDALLSTNLGEVPTELIRLPFERMYLDFSEHDFTGDFNGHKWWIRGVQLGIDEIEDKRLKFLRIHQVRYMEKGVDFLGQPFPFGFNMLMFRISPDKVLEIPDIKTVEDMAKNMNLAFPADWFIDGFFTKNPQSAISSLDAIRDVIELTINAILYINSANADLKEGWVKEGLYKKWRSSNGHKKTELKHELNKFGKLYRCGTRINIPTFFGNSTGGGSGGKIGVRFQVRGHWHHYWMGPRKGDPGEQKIKLNWVMPFWKGPELADIVNKKQYQVDTVKGTKR